MIVAFIHSKRPDCVPWLQGQAGLYSQMLYNVRNANEYCTERKPTQVWLQSSFATQLLIERKSHGKLQTLVTLLWKDLLSLILTAHPRLNSILLVLVCSYSPEKHNLTFEHKGAIANKINPCIALAPLKPHPRFMNSLTHQPLIGCSIWLQSLHLIQKPSLAIHF